MANGAPAPSLDPVSMGAAGLQAVMGIIQSISSNARMKKLMGQRVPYQTPQEIFKLMNATKSLASQGFDPKTFDFLNNQVDRGMSASIGAATRLGADPNTLSMIFDQAIQSKMKIGAENHAKNLENLNKYFGALETVAANKAAEQKSKDDLLKDQIQSAAGNVNQGVQNIGNAFNTFLSAYTSGRIMDLYKPNPGGLPKLPSVTTGITTDYLMKNNSYARTFN